MSTDAEPHTTEVVVGQVGPAFGLSGEVFVKPLTDVPERRFPRGARVIAHAPDGSRRDLTVAGSRDHSGRLVVHFEGFDTRESAATLTRSTVWAVVDINEETDEVDEYFDHQLAGLLARDPEGQPVGAISRVDHLPAGDYLVVTRAGFDDAWVPFRKEFVPLVDVTGGYVVIAAPPGLLTEIDDAD